MSPLVISRREATGPKAGPLLYVRRHLSVRFVTECARRHAMQLARHRVLGRTDRRCRWFRIGGLAGAVQFASRPRSFTTKNHPGPIRRLSSSWRSGSEMSEKLLPLANLLRGLFHLALEEFVSLLGEILNLKVDRCAHRTSPVIGALTIKRTISRSANGRSDPGHRMVFSYKALGKRRKITLLSPDNRCSPMRYPHRTSCGRAG
jgi:hypothetical protein